MPKWPPALVNSASLAMNLIADQGRMDWYGWRWLAPGVVQAADAGFFTVLEDPGHAWAVGFVVFEAAQAVAGGGSECQTGL